MKLGIKAVQNGHGCIEHVLHVIFKHNILYLSPFFIFIDVSLEDIVVFNSFTVKIQTRIIYYID